MSENDETALTEDELAEMWEAGEPVRLGRRPRLSLRLRAAYHELRCVECRVTWWSWLRRLAGIRSGYSP